MMGVEVICAAVILCVAGILISYLLNEQKKLNDMEEAQNRIDERNISDKLTLLISGKDSLLHIIEMFMQCDGDRLGTYVSISRSLVGKLQSLLKLIDEIKEENKKLKNIERSNYITERIAEIELQEIPIMIKVIESFELLKEKVENMPFSRMMDEKSYGKIDVKYWKAVNNLNKENVIATITYVEKILDGEKIEEISEIDLEMILTNVWYLAVEKTFSAADFQKAVDVFRRIYKCPSLEQTDRKTVLRDHVDITIADLYAKKKMGGEEVLRQEIHELLKYNRSSEELTLIASALMWMNAYQCELMVLQHMLSNGKEMTAKMQERLHSLTNGGGKAPGSHDVKSTKNAFYFDVSALAWRDEEYVGLFENLAFQDKLLSYALAVRDENKELFIAQGIQVLQIGLIHKKMEAVFQEEYGTSASVQMVKGIALSGNGEEQMEGILAASLECKQLGIFIHVARIGKKLIVKFYTLFMPAQADIASQKQQALSISKKLSPSVTMWESSLKDTMLMAVEQLLNAAVQPDAGKEMKTAEEEKTDTPVF